MAYHFLPTYYLFFPTDTHFSMLNPTARLAVRIQNLPLWEVHWADTQPQRSRATLTIDDILPKDATAVRDHALLYLMQFLTQEFKSLRDLAPLVTKRKSPHPVQKTQVAPMKIVFNDEKYKADTIEILARLREDARLTGVPEVNTTIQHCASQYPLNSALYFMTGCCSVILQVCSIRRISLKYYTCLHSNA